jgi:hypothetical protein
VLWGIFSLDFDVGFANLKRLFITQQKPQPKRIVNCQFKIFAIVPALPQARDRFLRVILYIAHLTGVAFDERHGKDNKLLV